jgi:hypothetical protein
VNWEALGATGESIAAIGVIFSLVYLARQVRSQSLENRLASRNSMANELNLVYGDISADAELSAIFLKGINDWDSLDPVEKVRLSFLINRFFRIFEIMFEQHRRRRLDDSFWDGVEAGLNEFCRYPGVRHWWGTREELFSKEMQALVAPKVATPDSPRLHEFQTPG